MFSVHLRRTELTPPATARHHSQPGWPWLGQSFSSANRPQSKCRGGLRVPSRGQSAIFRHGPLPAPVRLAKLGAGAPERTVPVGCLPRRSEALQVSQVPSAFFTFLYSEHFPGGAGHGKVEW